MSPLAVLLRIDLPYADHQGVFSGVNSYAQRANWTLVFDPRAGKAGTALIDGLETYDGIVGRVGRLGQEGLPRVRELGIPLVKTMYGGAREDLHGVYIDAETCGRLAAEHLLDRGFQRTAFVGIEGIPMSQRIGQAFCRTVNDRGGHACLLSSTRGCMVILSSGWPRDAVSGPCSINSHRPWAYSQLCHGWGG